MPVRNPIDLAPRVAPVRLENGCELTPWELLVIEQMRRRASDEELRWYTGKTQNTLIRSIAVIRGKLGCNISACEAVRDAADRLGLARIEVHP